MKLPFDLPICFVTPPPPQHTSYTHLAIKKKKKGKIEVFFRCGIMAILYGLIVKCHISGVNEGLSKVEPSLCFLLILVLLMPLFYP